MVSDFLYRHKAHKAGMSSNQMNHFCDCTVSLPVVSAGSWLSTRRWISLKLNSAETECSLVEPTSQVLLDRNRADIRAHLFNGHTLVDFCVLSA